MIRILNVFATLNRGGAETMCMNLYRHIDRTKVQFDFIKHTTIEGSFEKEILSLGGRVFEAPHYKIINTIQYKKWWREFFLRHPEYKIIHGHFFTISHIYFKIAHEFGVYTIGHSHSEKANYHSLKFKMKQKAIPVIEKESDACFACSNAAGKYLFPHRDFYVLNNAIDIDKFIWNPKIRENVRKELHIDDEVMVIGTCGRFSQPKNPSGIINIFSEIHELNPKAVLLWIGDGVMRSKIEYWIEEKGLQKSIILTGVRSDVNRLMQAMDVFILPSLWEGLAVVSIEAQAAGLPCFFSNHVTRECAITEQCFFLPIDNPKHWAETILSCNLERHNNREVVQRSGFDVLVIAEWIQNYYIKLYNNIIRKSQDGRDG